MSETTLFALAGLASVALIALGMLGIYMLAVLTAHSVLRLFHCGPEVINDR